ncbi:MAG: RluA family pseudouridine synthase [Clostridiales bacterium]|jgi:23S rRNA pseudouridine955/2504/2580 synthase|nr:RluA family pseudouridine synthase [Clostridiales bacterium]
MEKFIYNGNNAARILKAADGVSGLSYGRLAGLLRRGEIRVNGKKVYENVTVKKGDEITVFASAPKLPVVYEDENILAVYKRKGIKSDGDDGFEGEVKRGGYENAALRRMLGNNTDTEEGEVRRGGYENAALCHRLDTNTDGIVIFAKNADAEIEIFRAFKEHKIEKKYLALVFGDFKADGLQTAYLHKDKDDGVAVVCAGYSKGAERIETRFLTLERFENLNLSLLDITLVTGKTHQIRAHLKHLGCFVLGDGKYGAEKINRRFGIAKQQLTAYAIKFSFAEDGKLKYLNGKNIALENPRSFIKIPK